VPAQGNNRPFFCPVALQESDIGGKTWMTDYTACPCPILQIPALAYTTYKQKFEEPKESEGISTIVKVPPGAVSQAGWDKGLQWRL
jgi:hypothetical protein